MTKIKIKLALLFTTIVILVFSASITCINPGTTTKNGLTGSLKISDDSGGGYDMDTSATYSWIDISGSGTLMSMISSSDDDYETIDFLTWNFTFYENEYYNVSVSSNGWMSFPDSGYTWGWVNPIPDNEFENQDVVCPLCEDLYPDTAGDIYYEFLGTSPNRYLVIQFEGVTDAYGEGLSATFEVIFYENGDIRFQYQSVNGFVDFDPIIGLDHGDMDNYNSYSPSFPLTSYAILFTFDEMDGNSDDDDDDKDFKISGPNLAFISVILVISICSLTWMVKRKIK